MSKRMRVGIYAGSFNPVHSGHIAFALQAIKAGKLDRVYFMPERRPRAKSHVEHYGHRIAMLRQAVKPHPQLDILETDDVSFTVKRTHHRLQTRLKGNQLVYLMGSDVACTLSGWDYIGQLCEGAELIIGMRAENSIDSVRSILATLPIAYQAVRVIESLSADVSSKAVREGLRQRRYVAGLLASVAYYSNRNWLYISVA